MVEWAYTFFLLGALCFQIGTVLLWISHGGSPWT